MIKNFDTYIKENAENSYFFQTYKTTKDWLDFYHIKKYTINKDLTVDVDGSVDLHHQNLQKICVKFNIVQGNFEISNNDLTSLKGSPYIVLSNFICSNNHLINLEFSPNIIRNGISAYSNKFENINDLSPSAFIQTIKSGKVWIKELPKEIKDNYFRYWIEKEPIIFKYMKDLVSNDIKKEYKHLYQANNFDLI